MNYYYFHKCPNKKKGECIYSWGGKIWRIEKFTENLIIEYCPYCKKKLTESQYNHKSK